MASRHGTSRFGEHAEDRDDEDSRPTRFWGGSGRTRDSEASSSIGDQGFERYGERYRSERFRDYPQGGRQESQYGGRSADDYSRRYPEEYRSGQGREESDRGRFGNTTPDWSRGYSRQGSAGDDSSQSSGSWTGREQYPSGYYGQEQIGTQRATGPNASGHRGKGPKGYERTDERIKEAICERLTEDDSIDASEVSVNVAQGRVTLEGQVDSRRAKYDIEECAEQCGARDIINNLRIEQQGRGGQAGDSGTNPKVSGSGKEARGAKGH